MLNVFRFMQKKYKAVKETKRNKSRLQIQIRERKQEDEST